MSYNDPNLDRDKLFSGQKALFAVMLLVLGLLVYVMVVDIHNLPPDNSPQRVTLNLSQAVPVKQAQRYSKLQPSAAPVGDTHEVTLGFRVNGRIDQMFFAEHAAVKKGDILASLDKAPFEQALASARAQLQLAQAETTKSTHLPTSTFNAIEAARANVETAQHTYDAARDELEKRRGMIVAGALNKQLDNVYNDDVQNEHDAELNLQRMRRELAQREDEAGVNTNPDADKAAVQAAQANVAIAETSLADTQLVAPTDGIITSRAGEVGATIPAGSAVYVLSVPKTEAANR